MRNFYIKLVLFFSAAGLGGYALADGLALSLPSVSSNGAYIVKIISDSPTFDPEIRPEIELYRNKDGGRYGLIASGPKFTAISQMVNYNGTYGYKVRWKNADQLGVEKDFSDEVFIKVAARVTKENFDKLDKSKSSHDIKMVSARD